MFCPNQQPANVVDLFKPDRLMSLTTNYNNKKIREDGRNVEPRRKTRDWYDLDSNTCRDLPSKAYAPFCSPMAYEFLIPQSTYVLEKGQKDYSIFRLFSFQNIL